jgi:hypothetical protein
MFEETKRRMAGLITLAVTAVLFAFATAGALSAPRASATQSCGKVKGAAWHTGGKSGSTYAVVGANAAQCGIAKQWVPRLTRLTVPKLLKAGPSGYHCGAATGAHNSWYGGCLKGKTFAFSWGPR